MWKPINGASGYEVSADGKVRSIDRTRVTSNGQRRVYKGKEFTGYSKNQYGHKKVPITFDDGHKRMMYIHRLVADAFIGPTVGKIVCHGPLGSFDNRKENLDFGSHASNSADKIRDGTTRSGVRHPSAILSNEDVSAIKSLLGARTQKDISAMFGVSRATISAISTGRSWKSPEFVGR